MKDYDFYQNDPRYKSWVAYHLRNQESLMTQLNKYRTQAYNLLIAIHQKTNENPRVYHVLMKLISPKKTSLERCGNNNPFTLENGSTLFGEKERGFSVSSLVNNETSDTLKVYRGFDEFISEKNVVSIPPHSLKVLEHPQKLKFYFFRRDSCLGFTSHTKHNQLITIK